MDDSTGDGREANFGPALAAMTPRTKAGRVRPYFPLIEQKLAAGVHIDEILAVLKNGGLSLTKATLRSYLQRHRKQAATSPFAATGKTPLPAVSTNGQGSPGAAPCPPPATRAAPPTANAPPHATSYVPVSMEELERLMHPDPVQQADQLLRYERLAREARKKSPA